LPYGFIFIPKIQIWVFLERLGMKNVGIFMTICNILWPFGIFCGRLVYFSRFGMFEARNIWQPWTLQVQVRVIGGFGSRAVS
jgi:hypothetical protein